MPNEFDSVPTRLQLQKEHLTVETPCFGISMRIVLKSKSVLVTRLVMFWVLFVFSLANLATLNKCMMMKYSFSILKKYLVVTQNHMARYLLLLIYLKNSH